MLNVRMADNPFGTELGLPKDNLRDRFFRQNVGIRRTGIWGGYLPPKVPARGVTLNVPRVDRTARQKISKMGGGTIAVLATAWVPGTLVSTERILYQFLRFRSGISCFVICERTNHLPTPNLSAIACTDKPSFRYIRSSDSRDVRARCWLSDSD